MTLKMLTSSVLVVVAGLGAFGRLSAAPPPVPVYVFTATDPSGFADKDQRDRTATVEYLVKTFGKSKEFLPVATREAATLVIEVTRMENLLAFTHEMVPYRFATLSIGDYHTELHELRSPVGRGLATAIEAWVKANRAQLEGK